MGSDIDYLRKKGISVREDKTPVHMHHKFAIFDDRTLVNGSFNWTRSASKYNYENITVMTNPTLLLSFSKIFDRLWKEFA